MFSELLDQLPPISTDAAFDFKVRNEAFAQRMLRQTKLARDWPGYALAFADSATQDVLRLDRAAREKISAAAVVIDEAMARQEREREQRRGAGQTPFTRLITGLRNL